MKKCYTKLGYRSLDMSTGQVQGGYVVTRPGPDYHWFITGTRLDPITYGPRIIVPIPVPFSDVSRPHYPTRPYYLTTSSHGPIGILCFHSFNSNTFLLIPIPPPSAVTTITSFASLLFFLYRILHALHSDCDQSRSRSINQ